MGNTILAAYTKINLSLNVLPRTGAYGYYRVMFVNTQVDLADRVRISDSPLPGIRINQQAVEPSENLAYRAACLIGERYGIETGVDIDIEKHIPLKAGLGGGSADAAAIINGLDAHFGLSLADHEKNEIAQKLGMDVCYCVMGGLCTVGGVGERIERVSHVTPVLDLLIATPRERKPSTAWAYSILKEEDMGRHLDQYEHLLDGIERGDTTAIADNLHNDFEYPVGSHYPVTVRIKEAMLSGGAPGALLAGSGLSVFGIFSTRDELMSTKVRLEEQGHQCFATKTVA